MENVVSARRLRKTALKNSNYNINFDNIGLSDLEIKKKIKSHEKQENCENDSLENEKSFKFRLRYKILFKAIISINIILLCLVCKLIFKDQVLKNKYVNIIIDEYKYDYSKEDVLDKMESLSRKIYENGKYIIPEKIATSIQRKYLDYIKDKLITFSLKEDVNEVINVIFKKNINKDTQSLGIGGGEPIDDAKLKEVISAESVMDNDINQILSKNINIVVPVEGTITSRYGDREQIFDNVNPFHTGIDIANKLNTDIKSSTDGIVKKTENMNKYYGNNIEIESNGVLFKYAHLNKINVKPGDTVKQGDVIGLMGSTGMSTGSHLHFEIRINERTVDPDKILKFI